MGEGVMKLTSDSRVVVCVVVTHNSDVIVYS